MDINKNKITAIVYFTMILLALTGYFIWVIFFKSTKPKSEQISSQSANEKLVYKNNNLNVPTIPIPKPNLGTLSKEKALPTSIIPFFESISKAAKAVEAKLKNEITTSSQTQISPSAPSNINIPKSTPTEITLSLTNDEFRFLYPDVFIASLMDAQNLIKGFDSAYEPLPKIETDSQVRFVEEKIVTTFLSANIIAKDEAERFLTTIRFTLPQLQLMELENKATFSLNGFIPSALPNNSRQSSPKGLFLASLLEKLRSSLICPAQAYTCGGCYWSPECFQPGASSPTPGMNIWRVACYCTGCLYGQGCLDFCTGRAAIYDPTTGLCGCG